MSFGFGLRLQSATGWTLASAVQSLFGFGEQGVWYDVNDPNLGWRRNQLAWTEQFDNAAWIKTRSSVTANATTSPDGSTTADALIEDSTAANSHTIRIIPTVTAQTYTFSAYCKANQRSWVRLVNASAANGGAYFDLSTGAVGSVGSAATAEIVDVGNGWYRCSVTAVAISGGNSFDIRLAESDFGDFYDGDGTSGIYVWGAQVEEASTASTYQRITDGKTADFTALTGAIPTLYQDYQGVTPCSTPGQGVAMPVGLMLDKHKGLVLGSELVTNGDFSDGTTGWVAGYGVTSSTFTASGGVATLTQAGADVTPRYVSTITGLTIGRTYRVECEITATSGAGDRYVIFTSVSGGTGGVASPATTSAKYISIYSVATATTMYVAVNNNNAGAGSTTSFDNISVKEVPGNHAFQSTSASRPALSGKYSLLTYSEDLSNAAWTKNLCSVGSTVTGPFPDTTAQLVIPDGTSSVNHRVAQTVTTTVADYVASVYVKAGGYNYVKLARPDDTTGVNFDLTGDGSVLAGSGGALEKLSDGWFRLSVTYSQADTSGGIWVGVFSTSAFSTFVGDGTSGVYIWGADLRVANDGIALPDYQRVVDALTYDTTGFPLYLSCDGFDDWMATNSIDFSASDKMFVAAGVRKLSDAARGIIVESGINVGGVEDGTFLIDGPGLTPASDSFRFVSRGTFAAPTTAGAAYPAPISSVVAGLGDISGDSAVLRVNGVEVASDTTDQGTGNFGNYPLYLFRRAGTTYPFTGRFYNLVVRGGALPSEAQVAQVETYLNKTTQAYEDPGNGAMSLELDFVNETYYTRKI